MIELEICYLGIKLHPIEYQLFDISVIDLTFQNYNFIIRELLKNCQQFWINVIGLIYDLNIMCLNYDLLFFWIKMIKNLHDLFCYIILKNIYLL